MPSEKFNGPLTTESAPPLALAVRDEISETASLVVISRVTSEVYQLLVPGTPLREVLRSGVERSNW